MDTRFISQQAELILDYVHGGGKDGKFIALHAKAILEVAMGMPLVIGLHGVVTSAQTVKKGYVAPGA